MSVLKLLFVAVPVFAWILIVSAITVQVSGAVNGRDGRNSKTPVSTIPLNSMDNLEIRSIIVDGADPVKVQANVADYRGRRTVRIVNDDGPAGGASGGQILGIVKASDFKDGAIEADVAGFPRPGAKPSTRGFIGIAFRVRDHGSKYEAFYLRMTNGRANDQLQRNHAAQYVSHPDFPWNRLREENPGVYESYVDLDAGAWTQIRIVVDGVKAQLYVNGATHPCLVVNDLKLGAARGQVALWIGSDTEAYFSNLTIDSRD